MSDQRLDADDPRMIDAIQDYLDCVDRGEEFGAEHFAALEPIMADELRALIRVADEFRLCSGVGVATVGADSPTSRTAQDTRFKPTTAGEFPSALPQVFGKYRILEVLGRGAMGSVYLAEDVSMNRRVALKFPKFDGELAGELRARFYREARATGALRHPNICPVYEIDTVAGHSYIAMAYIQGQTLAEISHDSAGWSEHRILAVIEAVSRALQEAHDQGIVHRDLKPANVLIDDKGAPVILDFGLATQIQVDHEASRLTQHGCLIGSPAYMSPEQIDHPLDVTPAADQFSLGVIFYELLTGVLPFRGGMASILAQIVSQDPLPPRDIRPTVNPRVEALCLRMLAKSPAERFSSMRAVAEEIVIVLRSLADLDRGGTAGVSNDIPTSSVAATPRSAGSPPPAAHVPKRLLAGRTNSGRITNPRLAIAGTLLVVLLYAVVIWVRGKNGVLRVELNDPQLVVTIGNDLVTIDNHGRALQIREAGQRRLSVEYGGQVVAGLPGAVEVRRNEQRHLKVSYEHGTLTLDDNGKSVGVAMDGAAKLAPRSRDRSGSELVGPGLKAQYFAGINFERAELTRIDSHVDRIWINDAPVQELLPDNYSVRWTGWLKAPVPGDYTMAVISDDGVRLWIDGRLVIDDWNGHLPTRNEAPLRLDEMPHELRLEYHEVNLVALCSLRWRRAGDPFEIPIPRECLFVNRKSAMNTTVPAAAALPSAPGLQWQMFEGTDIGGTPTRTERCHLIDFLWGYDRPRQDCFYRWSGKLKPPQPGKYSLRIISDDGARVWIDGKLVIDQWHVQIPIRAPATVELLGPLHGLQVDYFNSGGTTGLCSLRWIAPGESEEVIVPPAAFIADPAGR